MNASAVLAEDLLADPESKGGIICGFYGLIVLTVPSLAQAVLAGIQFCGIVPRNPSFAGGR